MKRVIDVYEKGSRHWVGDGFPVRNLFPSTGLQAEVSPFLMLDYAGPADFPPSEQPRGVGEHPHRGFETVTIAYQGSVAHRDSAGNAGTIHPGDVQWMTAGSGLVHEEMHEREFSRKGGTFEMIQLWVNLPAVHKMTAPKYQELTSAAIPKIAFDGGGYARVIAGELNGVTGAAKTFSPVNVFDVVLNAGERIELPVPNGNNTSIFVRHGDVTINGVRVQGEAALALLDPAGDRVSFEAHAPSGLVVLDGEPIREPIASYGPFVMNTSDEIRQAFEDFRAGRMGRLR